MPDEEQPGPVSGAGAALLRFLGSDTMANAGRMLPHGRATAELVHQAIVILARRRFARQDGAGARAYAERLLTEDGTATGRRVAAAEAMLVGRLVGHPRTALAVRDQDLLLTLVVDLARELGPDRLPELVHAAEERLRRLLSHPRYQRLGSRLRYRRVARELRAAPAATGPPPRTPAGGTLAAIARFDFDRAQELLDGEDPDRAERVLHAAFAAAVRTCLGSADDDAATGAAAVRKVAVPIADQCTSVLITADVIVDMIVHELDPSAPPPDLDAVQRMEAEMSAVAALIDWFGLLPSEVRDLIAAAER